MDTLVALGTTAAWASSVAVTLFPAPLVSAGLEPVTYFDSSTIIIGLVLLGMRRVKDRTALLVAAGIYAYLFLTLAIAALFVDSTQFIDPTTAVAAAQETTANLTGSFSDVIG